MPRLVTAIVARNEASKDLTAVLADAKRYSDAVLLLDDHSTDDTPRLAEEAGATVLRLGGEEAMWGKEAHARAILWAEATKLAGEGWVLIQDADMILHGDPRPYTYTWAHNAWSWVLYDLWDESHYRSDQFWRGHEVPRAWMFCPSRVPEGWVPEWPERGIHTGHAPLNFPLASGVAKDLWWEHRAYNSPARRQAKHAQYLSVADQLSDFEKAHAQSILDPLGPAGGEVRPRLVAGRGSKERKAHRGQRP